MVRGHSQMKRAAVIRSPIQHTVVVTIALTIASITISLIVTDLALTASGMPQVPPVAYYLAAGLPGTIAPVTIYPLLRVINRQRLMRMELERLVGTDMLTDLPNRRAFFNHAARMMGRPADADRPLVAMMIDMDRFKAVNDSSGHGAGDDLLIRAAATIRDAVSSVDASDWVVARIGGDEFAVLVEGLAPSAAARLADRLCREMRDNGGAGMTVSVGVALRQPGMNIDGLLKDADDAVYRAKNNGRDRWAFAGADNDPNHQPPDVTRPGPELTPVRRVAAG